MKTIIATQAKKILISTTYMATLFLPTTLYASSIQNFVCENTRQLNGDFASVASKQLVSISSPRSFDKFAIIQNDNPSIFSELNNSNWLSSNLSGSYNINLKGLSKNIQKDLKKNLSTYISFQLNKSSSDFDVSPILRLQSKKSLMLPKSEVFFFDETTPIYESLGLPKNAHFIKTGQYYIEYNYNFGMINRIARTISSAYLYDAVVCTVDKDLQVKPGPLQAPTEDVTFNFDRWPKNLSPLKQSIAQLYFDEFVSNEEFTIPNSIAELIKQTDINELIINSYAKLDKVDNSKKNRILSMIKSVSTPPTTMPGLSRFLNSSHLKGVNIFTLDLDKTKEANNRKAYSYNKYVDLDLISKVSLNKLGKDYYFYFHPKSSTDHFIEVGPIDFKKMYWRESEIKYNSCTEKVMKHLNEYERKAFVFEKKGDAQVDSWDDLLRLQKLKKYPLEQFIITNNCRGPGNFEYEWPGLIKGYFQIPSKIMASIIDEVSPNVKFDEIATEVRPTKFYLAQHQDNIVSPNSFKDMLVSLWSKYKEDEYRWYRLGSFDSAKGSCLANDIETNLGLKNTDASEVDVTYDLGEINFQEFLGETRKKSSYIGEGEPLIYVKTPCSDKEAQTPPPFGFRAPRDHITTAGKDYWNQKTCEWIPHRFRYYKELTQYKIALSKFEVDGLYSGKSHNTSKFELSSYDRNLLKDNKSRMSFDFKKAWSFTKAKVRKTDDFISIELSSKDDSSHLILGNIPTEQLYKSSNKKEFKSYTRPWANDSFRGIYSLLGINPFPLSSYYGNIEVNERPIYSFFYDKDGEILNHHERDIGIEQWYIRIKDGRIIIDLLSHERITPVARMMLDL